MDDPVDDVSATEFMPLFITEEAGEPDRTMTEQSEGNKNPSTASFTGTKLKQSALIKPYLQEMDELLKSCEELTGISLGSHYSPSYTETSPSKSSHGQGKEEVTKENFGQAYLSTSYIDTDIDMAEREDKKAQDQSMASIINRDGITTGASPRKNMPLTSAGNKLSESMVEYEGQLLGMLAMLESCMEEAGMDFESRELVADAGQEYVHISNSPHYYRSTTLTPVKQDRPLELETHPVELESCVEEDKASKDSRIQVAVGSATQSQQSLFPRCEKMDDISAERPMGHSDRDFKMDQGINYKKFRFSGLQMLLDDTEKDPIYCEGAQTEHRFYEGRETKGDATESDIEDPELPREEREKLKMSNTDHSSTMNELKVLGSQMENYIEEVQQLEKRRKELLLDVLQLREQERKDEAEGGSMKEGETEEWVDRKVVELLNVLKKEEELRREVKKREMHELRNKRAEEEKKLWSVNLETQGLQEELRKLKRRLFTMVRDCAHNQAALNNQHREVELLRREEEKLNSLFLQLTEEGGTLKAAQQQRLSDIKEKLHAQSSSQTSSTQDELTMCRRHSCGDIQQYVQGGLKALEDRYEPILLALLKRRETTAGALVKAKEEAQELRAKLRPLREEIQELKLKRTCLETKLKLIHAHRNEDVEHYKETIYFLEESSRELKTQLEIQKRKTREMEELRDSLTKQLLIYRTATEDHNKGVKEDDTT